MPAHIERGPDHLLIEIWAEEPLLGQPRVVHARLATFAFVIVIAVLEMWGFGSIAGNVSGAMIVPVILASGGTIIGAAYVYERVRRRSAVERIEILSRGDTHVGPVLTYALLRDGREVRRDEYELFAMHDLTSDYITVGRSSNDMAVPADAPNILHFTYRGELHEIGTLMNMPDVMRVAQAILDIEREFRQRVGLSAEDGLLSLDADRLHHAVWRNSVPMEKYRGEPR